MLLDLSECARRDPGRWAGSPSAFSLPFIFSISLYNTASYAELIACSMQSVIPPAKANPPLNGNSRFGGYLLLSPYQDIMFTAP